MPQLNKIQAFVDDLLKRVPEDQREAVRSMYSQASDEATSLDQEIARVRAVGKEQKEWYDANKTALEKAKEVLAGGGGGSHTIDPDAITKQIGAVKDEVLTVGLALMNIQNNIVASHITEFPGERLDMNALTKGAQAAGMSLQDFYDREMAPKRKERADAALKKTIEEAEARGEAKGKADVLAKLPQTAMPYPVVSSAPTTLTGLRKPADGQAGPDYLKDAVATANEVMSRQTA